MRNMRSTSFVYAAALLTASTIGVGFFGIPSTMAQSGIGIGLIIFAVLSVFVVLSNLAFGEVVLRTHQRHQFVGYVKRYLGRGARIVNQVNFWISGYGAMIAVLILNGSFAHNILAHFGVDIGKVTLGIFFLIIALILVYNGLKTVSHVDLAVMAAAIGIIALVAIAGLPNISIEHFKFSSGVKWFLPFGVILFALNGVQGIPLTREVLVGREHLYKKAILVGSIIPIIAYFIFSVVVVGISGPSTSEEAILGLSSSLGDWVVLAGSLVGFLTSSTIFLSICSAFRASLIEDFHLKRRRDFLFLMAPPVILYLFGVQDFIRTIGLVGGVAVSIDMILLLFVYARAKTNGNRVPEYSLNIPKFILYAMMLVFALGAIYTIAS